MKLNVDLSALHRAVAPLGAKNINFSVTSLSLEIESISEGLAKGKILGEDIQLNEIDGSNGVLGYNGLQVMLYIPDQGANIEAVLKNGKQKCARKVHIAECKTIIEMREKGRFNDRYDVVSRIDGLFPVFGTSSLSHQKSEGDSNLAVCKNCLLQLNYLNFRELAFADKSEIVENFSFIKLFESYSSYFSSLPKSTVGYQSAGYTSDWPAISTKIRSKLNYMCEQCGVNLQNVSKLLHVHHINGNKSDNTNKNLRALCADCHTKQPHHGHLYVSNKDTLRINFLRRKQNKCDVYDYKQLEKYSDSALTGLLNKCKSCNLPVGELGVVLNIDENYIAIDLCWPRRKVAVVINPENIPFLAKQGWNAFTAFNALDKFENFQSYAR